MNTRFRRAHANGNIVNGKKARFSEDELRTLSNALQEISEQLKAASFVF